MEKEKNDPFASLRYTEFRYYFFARLCISIAIFSQSVCVGWQIYDLTKDPLSLGLIGLVEAIPFILIALYAGYVVDHYNRKKIILTAIGVLFLTSIALYYLSANKNILLEYGTLPIYIVIFITGLARGFISPSASAILSQLVPKKIYSNSSTWNSTIGQIGMVTGPALGGLVYGFYGGPMAYLINIFFFFISFSLFSMIKSKKILMPESAEGIFNKINEGLKFVFSTQLLIAALSLDLFAVFFGGAIALLPIFANEILNVGPEGLGLLRSAPAFGASLMAVFLIFKPLGEGAGKKLLYAVAGFGVSMIAFALSTNFYLSIVILIISGAFDNISVVIRTTIVQTMTPDHMRGRVSSISSIFIGSSNEIGAFESGFAAKFLGLIPSVIFGGSMTVLVVAITSKLAPKLKKLNLSNHD